MSKRKSKPWFFTRAEVIVLLYTLLYKKAMRRQGGNTREACKYAKPCDLLCSQSIRRGQEEGGGWRDAGQTCSKTVSSCRAAAETDRRHRSCKTSWQTTTRLTIAVTSTCIFALGYCCIGLHTLQVRAIQLNTVVVVVFVVITISIFPFRSSCWCSLPSCC